MSETASTDPPRRRILAEGVAIVVSILLAFAIDAWWDEARERSRERTVLTGLRAEFEANRTRLGANLAQHEGTHEAAVALMDLSDSGAALPPDSMAYLLRRVFVDAYSYNPSGGVLEGLIASGELGLIRDTELRGLLASWPGQLDENAEDEAWVFKDVQDVYTPYVNRVLPTRNIWTSGTDLPRARDIPDYSVVLGTTEFENLVGMRAYGARILVYENEELMDLVDRIVGLIDRELD
jgi:hypothetical protein